MDPHHRVILTACALTSLSAPDAYAQEDAEASSTGHAEAFAPSVSFGVGLGAAQRDLFIQGDSPVIDGQSAGTYLGGNLHAAFWMPRSDSGTQLGATFEGRYGVTRGDTRLDELGREPIAEHYLGALHIALARRLDPATTLELRGGVQATSFLVAPNALYTGHRYVNASVGALLARRFLADTFSLTAGAFVLPNIDTNESSRASGPASSFGIRGQASLGYNLSVDPNKYASRRIGFELRYDFQRLRTQYPEGLRFGPLGGASDDNQHGLTLVVHYAL